MNPFLMGLLQQGQSGQNPTDLQSLLSGFGANAFLNPLFFPQGKKGQSNPLAGMLGLQPIWQSFQNPPLLGLLGLLGGGGASQGNK